MCSLHPHVCCHSSKMATSSTTSATSLKKRGMGQKAKGTRWLGLSFFTSLFFLEDFCLYLFAPCCVDEEEASWRLGQSASHVCSFSDSCWNSFFRYLLLHALIIFCIAVIWVWGLCFSTSCNPHGTTHRTSLSMDWLDRLPSEKGIRQEEPQKQMTREKTQPRSQDMFLGFWIQLQSPVCLDPWVRR